MTALGWAVVSWSSPELISVLTAAGARVDTKLSIYERRRTPLEYVRFMKEQLADKEFGPGLREWQDEFWGRVPTAAWFNDVERILLLAKAARKKKRGEARQRVSVGVTVHSRSQTVKLDLLGIVHRLLFF